MAQHIGPSQLFEGRSIANHYPIVVPHPSGTAEAAGGEREG